MSDPDAHLTDERLVEAYLDGDPAAFRELVERHHDGLLRFLFRLTGDRQMAEDVFQDAFLQVHQSLDTFDLERRFKPWLFTIAANKARDALRRAQRRRAVSLSHSLDSDDDGGGRTLIDLLSIDLPGPGLRLEAEEQSEMVQRAIAGMTPKSREILLMAYFQKLSYQHIAEAFEIPLGTVKSRLHAAVASFAQKWQEQVEARKLGEDSAEAAGRKKRPVSGEPG
ncbi:MAG: sigma-70 family RNA polymerase sigma factor [Phycisphaerales bacterium]|nr:sigma-70 family RNA polymerase sigma factor [Phycisphaerales bacterium]